MRRKLRLAQGEDLPINEIRRLDVSLAFKEAAGRRALIIISPFPFLVIGEIVDVLSDYVFIKVETTSITELEERTTRIHVDDVEVFYIEDDGPPIPRITDNPGHIKRGEER